MKKSNRKLYAFILIIASFFTPHLQSANILFDLGGVLLKTSQFEAIKQLGIKRLLSSLINGNNPFKAKIRLFKLLKNLQADYPNTFGAQDGKGREIPSIMCDWLANTKTNDEIKAQINQYVQENPDNISNSDKKFLKETTDILFSPQFVANIQTVIPDGLKFVEECSDSDAEHNLFILSNWEKDSFDLTKDRFPELFNHFEKENMIISGEIQLIKPDPKIYHYALDELGLDKKTCIFFDDQQVNVDAAKACGIHAVLCKKASYTDMKAALDAFIAGEHEQENNTKEIQCPATP